MFQNDVFHQIVTIVMWLVLALMATSVTPEPVWAPYDALVFSLLKLVHASIR
jgi:hypothetical protein